VLGHAITYKSLRRPAKIYFNIYLVVCNKANILHRVFKYDGRKLPLIAFYCYLFSSWACAALHRLVSQLLLNNVPWTLHSSTCHSSITYRRTWLSFGATETIVVLVVIVCILVPVVVPSDVYFLVSAVQIWRVHPILSIQSGAVGPRVELPEPVSLLDPRVRVPGGVPESLLHPNQAWGSGIGRPRTPRADLFLRAVFREIDGHISVRGDSRAPGEMTCSCARGGHGRVVTPKGRRGGASKGIRFGNVAPIPRMRLHRWAQCWIPLDGITRGQRESCCSF